MVDATAGVDPATGAALRRRERRLRAYLKYARTSVAMVLAEARHHTAPRRQRTATAEATNDASTEPDDECGRGYRVLLAVRGRARGYAA